MAKYVAKRLAALVVILFFVTLGTFFLVHLLPGKPAVAILGPNATAHNIAVVNHQLGLDKPLWQQYVVWLGHVLQGDLGQSFVTHQSVVSTIANAFPIDVELIVISQIVAFAVAVPLAIAASRRPYRAVDTAATAGTFALLAMPPFIVAPLLVLVFSVDLHVFPGPASYVPIGESFWSNIHAMLLPSIVVAIGSIVLYYRLLRNDLISTLQEGFVTMARSKGLSERRLLYRHALRPSSVSLLASAGINIGSLIAGTFVVEFLLQLPGLGYELVVAINQDDYLVVQGIVLVIAVAVVVLNVLVDFLFTVVDPRISLD
ncbi:MAG TPA: ABC transporter permease [Acidimicrobiales bacterium]|nr:ABC transporter permease [Acidimicrobiales bacterium]